MTWHTPAMLPAGHVENVMNCRLREKQCNLAGKKGGGRPGARRPFQAAERGFDGPELRAL